MLLFYFFSFSFFTAVFGSSQTFTLGGTVNVTFTSVDQGVALTSFKSLATGVEHLSPDNLGLFEIDLVGTSGSLITLTNLSPSQHQSITQDGNTVTVTIMGLLSGCVNIQVTLTTDTKLPFAVPASAVRWGYTGTVMCIGFYSPRVTRITAFSSLQITAPSGPSSSEEPRIWVPHGFGASGLVPNQRMDMRYPGEATMQYLTYSKDKHGMFLATLCGGGSNKIYTVGTGDVQGTGAIILGVPVFGGGLGNTVSWQNPFPIVSIPYEGTDYDAALIYRSFAMKWAGWINYKVYERADSLTLSKTQVWFNSGWQEHDVFNETQGDPSVVTARLGAIASRFPTIAQNSALHWYVWDQIKFDMDYPDYFPPKVGFGAAVGQLQKLGYRIFPYINGRLWDTANKDWTGLGAARYAAKNASFALNNPNQTVYEESYGSGATLAVMCPATPFWQDTITEVVAKLVDLGVDGVYVDQVAAAYPAPCFDPSHNHTVGGGNYWSHGYWAMMGKVNQTGISMTLTEANAETYMASFSGYLTLTAFADLPTTIRRSSTFPSIYGGYYNGLGAIFFQTDITEGNMAGFKRKLATMFVEGAQLGWFSLGGTNDAPKAGLFELLLGYQNGAPLEIVETLVRYRSHLSVLSTGRMLRPVCDGVAACQLPWSLKTSVWGGDSKVPGWANTLLLSIVNHGNSTIYLSNLSPPAAYELNLVSYMAEIGVTGSTSFNVYLLAADGTRSLLRTVQRTLSLTSLPDALVMEPIVVAITVAPRSSRRI